MRHSDFLPEGWRKIIGDALNNRLQEFMVKGGKVLQVKEKFGELRVYSQSSEPLNLSDLSEICDNTCMQCGEAGTMTTVNGWIGPRCEEHSK